MNNHSIPNGNDWTENFTFNWNAEWGYLVWNHIERMMGSLTFGTQVLALDRLESTREAKDKIKQCNNIKGFVDK